MTELDRSPHSFKDMPKPYERKGWGILNRFNDLWSDEIFDTPELAAAYVSDYWNGKGAHPEYISGYRYVPIKRTVNVSHESQQIRIIVAKPRRKEPEHV